MDRGTMQPMKLLSNKAQPNPNASQVPAASHYWPVGSSVGSRQTWCEEFNRDT